MQGLADIAVKVLKEAMEGDDPRARILAANAVLDRGYGKPAQSVNAKIETLEMVQGHLAALQELIAKCRDEPLSVDGVPSTALVLLTAEGSAD